MSTVDERQEGPILQELLKHIKSESKCGISSCLVRLKNDSKCYKQFAKDGGLGILVNLLHYHNVKILNMTLSILANACMNPDAREKVKGSKIANRVVSILKHIKLGNTLHCRACRLIGNLSECEWHAKSLCEAGVIQALVDCLQLDTNMQTYLMGVRAIRNIWRTHEGSTEEILESGIICRITGLLVSAKEKSETNTKYLELIETCLKAACAFLATLDPRVGEQMRGEKDIQGYKCIIQCCDMNNKIAIKCLYNLCQIAECRPILGNSGAIEILIVLIKDRSELSKEILVSLCLFCREAVNRARVRMGSGLELMLSLLKDPSDEKYHPMLLHALAQFVYDDPSIVIMIKNGLLDVLVTRLKKMVTETITNDEIIVSKKRGSDSPPSKQNELKYNKTSLGRFSSDYYCDDWSPGSAASVSSSPPSTPPLPFYDSIENDENTEDNYSPVCSDTEFMDNEDEPQTEVESLKSCKSIIIDVEESQNSERSSKSNVCEYANVWTLVLLSRLSHSNDPIDRLADPPTIEALSAYIRHTKNPRASRILTRIIRNGAYLISLLKQGFVFKAQTLYGSEQYTRQLCALAETGGAIGELTSILLRGEDTHKQVIAVSIPFLIKSRYILKSLLNNHGGLRLIFNVLSDQQHTLYENAIWSICRLANTLEIQPEIMEKCQITDTASTDFPRVYDNHPKPATVTFELDDGTTVDACRQTLCQKSDAFSAMLEGNFSESGKKRVKLRNTSKEGLNTLLLAANGATFETRTIESLLDAVLLADKFLMADISDILTESSISKLNYKNFSRAWNWAKANSCHELKSCCVKSFLTASMTRSERVQAFQDFSTSGNFHEFLDDMKEIINNVLCQR
ncbi:Armadillo repeat-containing protein 5 [Habropoda laboriosa]|uniref:Armadillo repeat-containing protein 5 n=1 Tax=Habropoda laboriosa TaxID=597456 RepID=A0A0L7R8E5_9HYME|nr:PREDICTED: armadillo repeat-containing protein 5 [Habropoda laboriosa]KOC67114.1 Armadillo repeat-containing protein 5 [Habropoda laboriosa]